MLARPLGLKVGVCFCCLGLSCGTATDAHPSANGAGAGGTAAGGAGAGGVSDSVAGQPSLGSGGGGESGEAGADPGSSGAAGEAGAPGAAIAAGLVVVGTTVAGATPTTTLHFLVLLDPTDGRELARTRTALSILGIAYEAARDKWFVFTGTPGQGGAEPNGPLLVGSMTTTGFVVEQTAMVPKPTNSKTIAVLNERILYRTASHVGASQVDDTLTLVDTSAAIELIGKLTIPFKYALVGAVGAPATDGAIGGRAFFLHDNLDDADNCVPPTVGTEPACTIYASSLAITSADTNLVLPESTISSVAQIDQDGSDAAIGVQASGHTVVVVAPPQRALDTHAGVYRYESTTGEPIGTPLRFSLESAAKKVDPTNSITIPTVAVDPCAERLFTGELANTGLLYAVPFAAPESVVAFDPASHDKIVGSIAYEPFTHTLISYNSNPDNPTFSGLLIAGTLESPQISVRGMPGSTPWQTPPGLAPALVAVRTPVTPPCP